MNEKEIEKPLTQEELDKLTRLRQAAAERALQIPIPASEAELAPIFEHFQYLEGIENKLVAAAKIGVDWVENSSLEKWFPLTAEELAKLKRENEDLRQRLARLITLRKLPEWQHPGQLHCNVVIDREVARNTEIDELLTCVLRDAITVIKRGVNA